MSVVITGFDDSPDVSVSGDVIEVSLPADAVSVQVGLQGPAGGSQVWVVGETPTGLVNGSNATYTTAFSFVPLSVAVLVNGVAQRRVTDFNTSGTTTIILTESPQAGEAVRVTYLRDS